MTRIILIRGVPGTGKTTLAQEIAARNPDFVHIESDHFFQLPSGQFKFNPRLFSYAHKWCINSVARLVHQEFTPVVSNSLCRQWEIEPYIKIAMAFDTKIEIISLTTEYGSLHNIPENRMQEFRDRFEPEVFVPHPVYYQGEP